MAKPNPFDFPSRRKRRSLSRKVVTVERTFDDDGYFADRRTELFESSLQLLLFDLSTRRDETTLDRRGRAMLAYVEAEIANDDARNTNFEFGFRLLLLLNGSSGLHPVGKCLVQS